MKRGDEGRGGDMMQRVKRGQWPALWAVFAFVLAGCADGGRPEEGRAIERASQALPVGCTSVTVASSVTGPVTSGASVTFTASAACASPEYQFAVRLEGTTTQVAFSSYSSANQLTWNTTGLASGKYRVTVWVRAAGTTSATASTNQSLLVGSVCTGATITASPTGAGPGTPVTFSAASTCTSGTAEYRWLVQAPGARSVTVARTWGSAAHTWDTTGLAAGSYTWTVEARALGNLVADSSASASYNLQTTCGTGFAASASPTTTSAGTPVTVTASSSCNTATATPQYRFSSRLGTSAYTVFRDWGANGSASWATTGLASGTYTLRVEVRASGSTVVQGTKLINVTLGGGCSAVSLAASPTSPRPAGTTITLSSAATCVSGSSPQYRFLVRAPNTSSDVELRGWGASSYSWSTTGALAGSYTLTVQARASSTATASASKSISFTLGPVCTAVVASLSPSSTQPVGANLHVSALASCGGSAAEYRFSTRVAGTKPWTVFREFSATNSATLDTAGAAAGSYELLVEARGLGQTTGAQTMRALTFTLANGCAAGTVPDGTGGCIDPQGCGVEASSTAQGDVRGAMVSFANGASLPAGTYTVSYEDGCMRYTSAVVWTVHAATDGATGWVIVGSSTIDVKAVTPGTVGTSTSKGGYGTLEACVTANAAQAPVTFEHAGGPLALWLNDATYADNASSGTRAPTFTLTRDCTAAPACDDGVQNGAESDVDCGGDTCAPCAAGYACADAADCITGACTDGLCAEPGCAPGLLDVYGDGSECEAFVQVSAGSVHTCARTSTGRLFCWGDNTYGQRGDGEARGASTPPHLPRAVAPHLQWESVSVGMFHTCGVAAGRLYCWGLNHSGVLGRPWLSEARTPVEVGATGWQLVTAFDVRTCGVRNSQMYCWGYNGPTSPVPTGYPLPWSHIVQWDGYLGGVAQGVMYVYMTYGSSNMSGAHNGWMSAESTSDPYGTSGCGIRGGHPWCWGSNASYQLGNPSYPNLHIQQPAAISAPTGGWTTVTIGKYHACAIRTGQLYCWGMGADGQLGLGAATGAVMPTPVGSDLDWQAIDAGGYHSCGIRSGAVYCWGRNTNGELGSVEQSSIPQPVAF